MAVLGDLVTVLYRPRETMRRVLDARDRWAPQIVVLAFLCASVKDTDSRPLTAVLPGIGWAAVALILLGLVAGALFWLALLYLLSWITTLAGHRMGGTGTTSDVRAALAWGMVPVIWSVIVLIPLEFAVRGYRPTPGTDATAAVLDFFAQGGCSLLVISMTFQLLVTAWCVYIASCCVGEAQQFSSGKGFASVAIVFALPVVIGLAVLASQHLHF